MSNKAISTQITLWNEIPRVPEALTTAVLSEHRNKEKALTGESIHLLPITAGKDKVTKVARPSLKLQNPDMTVAQLKELHKSQGMEMKGFLGAIALSLTQNKDVIGLGARVGKNGRVSLVYKKDVPQVDMLTDEELAVAMGRDVAWVKRNRKSTPVEVQVELQTKPSTESKANGKAKAGNVVTPPVSTPAS